MIRQFCASLAESFTELTLVQTRGSANSKIEKVRLGFIEFSLTYFIDSYRCSLRTKLYYPANEKQKQFMGSQHEI